MLKGINRQMIEIVQPDNPYFEKALLVVRADLGERPPSEWQQYAADAVRHTDGYSGLRRGRFRYRLTCACWSALGTAFGILIGLLIGRYI